MCRAIWTAQSQLQGRAGLPCSPNACVSCCSPAERVHPLPPAWVPSYPHHVTKMSPSQQGFEQAVPFGERNEAQQTSQQQRLLSRRNPSPLSRPVGLWCMRCVVKDVPTGFGARIYGAYKEKTHAGSRSFVIACQDGPVPVLSCPVLSCPVLCSNSLGLGLCMLAQIGAFRDILRFPAPEDSGH